MTGSIPAAAQAFTLPSLKYPLSASNSPIVEQDRIVVQKGKK
jgi:hypothetical protein